MICMKIKTELRPADAAGIARGAELLRQGELVALPTETVYGIAADARNGEAVKKIFVAKGRPQDNPLIVHIAGPDMLPGLVSEVPERAQLLMAAFCPGPLTIIMPRGPEVAAECCAGLDTVGIRMPSHPVVQAIIRQSGCAFAAPSANLSGKPSPTNAQDVFTDMDGRLPLILDGGECAVGVESTVISVVGEKPTLFRPGHITLEELERALGEEVEVSKAILEKLPEGAVVRSPGMKYKHYAPKADVTLLEGSFEQFKAYVDAHADQNPSCLCFTGEAEKLGVPCVEYGREGDGADQAKHIFRSLRALDEQGDSVVYARCPQKDGLSMAVYNRLIRAAAFRVIDYDHAGHYGPQRLRQIHGHVYFCCTRCPAGRCRSDVPGDLAPGLAIAAPAGGAVRGRYPPGRWHAGPPPAGRPGLCNAGGQAGAGRADPPGNPPPHPGSETGGAGSWKPPLCAGWGCHCGHGGGSGM